MKKTYKFFCFLFSVFLALPFSAGTAFAEQNGEIDVKARSCILMDAATGAVFYENNSREKLYPASVTKIMSILLVMEAIDSGKLALTDKITASPEAAAKGGSQIWLKEGETMTADELLRAAVIGSANDACAALGEKIAGSEEGFVRMMNERARQLGMTDTNFVNCTGLDDDTTEHLTSARDIALMSKQLLSHDRIRNYTTVWMDSLRGGKTELVNTNKLVRFYKGTTGLKTGTTSKAGACIAASAERDGLHLIAVVMGSANSNDRFEGAKALLNYGFARYETFTPEIDKSLIADVRVIGGIKSAVTPKIGQITPLTLEKGKKAKIKTEIDIAADAEAPVEQGQRLGSVRLQLDGKTVCEIPLTAPEQVRRLKLSDCAARLLRSLSAKSAPQKKN